MKRFAVAIAALSVAALIGLRTERASASAFDLHFTENCYGYGADVKLKWTGQVPTATQYVDYTRVNNGFAAGTFLSSGPLGGTAETFTATHLTPNVPYLVRVNQLNNGTWSASETWVIQPCSSLDVQKTSLMNSNSPNKPNTYCGINCAMSWNNPPTYP